MVKEMKQNGLELANFIRFGEVCWGSDGVLRSEGKDEMRVSKRNGLNYMTLREFISWYSEELGDYYGGEFWFHELDTIDDDMVGDTVIFCLVDTAEEYHIPKYIKEKIKKAGKWRRDKLKHQWYYGNPFNRIHGYIILKDVSNTHRGKKTMSVSSVCSTFFTEKKGIGSDLMELAKEYAKGMECHDIVLEVANEYSGIGFPEEESEEESEEEEEEEESEEEESEEESGEEEDEEETWYPCESAIAIIAEEFWKKCMRKNNRGIPTFNLEQEYIEESIRDYMFHEYNSGDAGLAWKGTGEKIIKDTDEPGENEYGGFWYLKGKRSQERLMKFYEMHGYREDPEVHLSWGCFSEIPYPTMRLQLE
jgi:GNAT superfamily N-acetyltransferase